MRALAAVLFAILTAGHVRAADTPRRPNVILVLVDDLGWADLGCFGGPAATGNIDRLAAEGIRFRRFYVNAPICSPSRVALTTGQYPQRWRITSYLDDREHNAARGMAQWLDPAAPVLARARHRAGYATGHFGKWHMGGQRDVGDAPLITAYGFDRSLTNFEGLGPRVLPLLDARDGTAPRRHDIGSAELGRGPIRWENRAAVTASFVAEAVAFVDEAVRDGKPFSLNLWPDDVHSPYFPAARLAPGADKRTRYLAVLEEMDRSLGVLFDRIRDDPKLRNDTLILLCADNGHDDGAGSSAPLRGGKTWLYEGGVRSPLIAWAPGLTPPAAAGGVDEATVFCSLDLNRSLYEITGTPLPTGTMSDGEDVSAALTGRGRATRQAPIFWRRPPDRPGKDGIDNPDLAAGDGRWKYYVNFDGGTAQLFDVEADPAETKNLVATEPDIAARLQRAVETWNASVPPDACVPR